MRSDKRKHKVAWILARGIANTGAMQLTGSLEDLLRGRRDAPCGDDQAEWPSNAVSQNGLGGFSAADHGAVDRGGFAVVAALIQAGGYL